MLQQTQVTTVIPYFERWMGSFPDLATLAKASLDDVLAQWSGLGYYARARNLHKAAALCMKRHSGDLPESVEDLSALPGIGQSTANAIVSQSTDQPTAVLDGNVRRLLARHAAIEGWTGKTSVQKQLWKQAESRLPGDRGADYTQAIMDLGAMICTRSMPGCDRCPVSSGCQALKLDKVSELPWPRPATKVTDKTIHMLILKDEQDRVLLEKRPPAGIWGGLWCFPEGDSINTISAGLGISCTVTTALPVVEHRLSHIRMTIRPALTTATDARQVTCSPQHDWFNREQQQGLGLPKPVKDLLSRLNDGEYK
jgi:A/G-specific adenine glycosylase